MPLFHRHDWQLADKTIMPSGFQQLVESGMVDRATSIDGHMSFTTKVVLSWRCAKCGGLRVVTESNP